MLRRFVRFFCVLPAWPILTAIYTTLARTIPASGGFGARSNAADIEAGSAEYAQNGLIKP
jgi:hypothetical protein